MASAATQFDDDFDEPTNPVDVEATDAAVNFIRVSLNVLPRDLLVKLIRELPPQSALALCQVDQRFAEICRTPGLFGIPKDQFMQQAAAENHYCLEFRTGINMIVDSNGREVDLHDLYSTAIQKCQVVPENEAVRILRFSLGTSRVIPAGTRVWLAVNYEVFAGNLAPRGLAEMLGLGVGRVPDRTRKHQVVEINFESRSALIENFLTGHDKIQNPRNPGQVRQLQATRAQALASRAFRSYVNRLIEIRETPVYARMDEAARARLELVTQQFRNEHLIRTIKLEQLNPAYSTAEFEREGEEPISFLIHLEEIGLPMPTKPNLQAFIEQNGFITVKYGLKFNTTVFLEVVTQ